MKFKEFEFVKWAFKFVYWKLNHEAHCIIGGRKCKLGITRELKVIQRKRTVQVNSP